MVKKAGRQYACRQDTGYRIIAKTEEYRDKKSGEEKRKSPAAKNEMMQKMIKMHIQNQVKFTFIPFGVNTPPLGAVKRRGRR
jgi:hypothetical protein